MAQARTNADKRRQVLRMLDDAEWAKLPQTDIARHCGVSQQLVSKLKLSYHCSKIPDDPVKQVTRNGTTYTMDTTHIGQSGQHQGAVVSYLGDTL